MNNNIIEYWNTQRGKIRSRKGGWRVGKGVFCHGYNLLEDLAGSHSYFQVLILQATGRLPDKKFADWCEAFFICLSWPDARIWCNQIGALGGTVRASVVAATVAGILAGDSRAYGQRTLVEGLQFIQGALKEKRRGLTARDIVHQECKRQGGKPQIMGYARPIAKGDERIIAMERVGKELGFDVGAHLSLAYEIENVLLDEFDEGMNIGGFVSAFFSDQGYSPKETYQICSVLIASGVTACYVDTYDRPPENFLPMHCDDIDYQGPPPRPVPEK
ncbi:hypothetical protein [Geoalkalibacter halelectricus]|uniref:hypothetical protein n=1 Tax=Geoalkalibacter halelectricus TaxID=2847045 RepID=UPI003D22BFFF